MGTPTSGRWIVAAALALAVAACAWIVAATVGGDDDAVPPSDSPAAAARTTETAARPAAHAAAKTDAGGARVDVDDAPIPEGATLTIRGTVRDDTGRAVAGARVLAAGRSPMNGPSAPVVETDASGDYVVPGLDPRTIWTLAAYADGLAPGPSASAIVATARRLDVRYDFVLPRRGRIDVVVTDAAGTPLPHDVWVVAPDSQPWSSGPDSRALDPGRYRVVVASNGHASDVRVVDVAPGAAERVEFRLGDECGIAGTLLAADGSPMQRFTVVAHDAEIPDSSVEHRCVTDADGAFRFTGMRPATYELRVDDAEFALDGDRVVAPATGVRLTARDDGRVSWRLVYPPEFTDADRAADVGVTLSVGERSRRLAVHWDRDEGSAAVPGGEDATLTFAVPNCVKLTKAVRVRPGETADLGALTLEQAFQVAGRVVDVAGNGVGNANVVARVGGTEVVGGTSADGWFVVAPLPRGDGTVEVKGYDCAPAPVALHAGGTERVIVVLTRGGRLVLRDAAACAAVRATSAGGYVVSATADSFGEAVLTLAPGRWRVEAAGRDPADVDVRDGATTTVRLAGVAR